MEYYVLAIFGALVWIIFELHDINKKIDKEDKE